MAVDDWQTAATGLVLVPKNGPANRSKTDTGGLGFGSQVFAATKTLLHATVPKLELIQIHALAT